MAKPKSFKNELNPALQFISIQNTENEQGEEIIENSKSKQNVKNLYNSNDIQNTNNLNHSTGMQNKIMSKDNAKIDGYKINHQYIETKSKRVQLLMQPSLHANVKAQANANGISINEYIHSLLCAEFDKD